MSFISQAQSGDPGSTLRVWSSLIGIITAIVGNILISFALNIQRYAHIRLGREHDESKDQWNGVRNGTTYKSYGTQQSKVADERARLNVNTSQNIDTPQALLSDDLNTPGKMVQPRVSTASINHYGPSEPTGRPSKKAGLLGDKKTYLRSPYWWCGIILMTTGEAGNFLAYGFAPASIVSPLGVVALVSNCIIAPCLLKEPFRQRDFWGVMVAIAGAITIVLSAKNSEGKMGPHDVWAAITRWEFEIYLGITAGLMVVLIWASEKYGENTILIDLGLVGLFGGYTALSTKGVASLLSDTLWRALTFPVTYLLGFILIITALMQIRYVNRALQRFNSTQVIPIQFVLFTISVIIGSAILYRDFESATIDRIGKFAGGCLLTFIGVYLITSGRAGGTGDDDYPSLGDEEDAIDLVDGENYEEGWEVASDGPDRSEFPGSSALKTNRGATISSALPEESDRLYHPPPQTPSRSTSNLSSASSRGARDIDPFLIANPWKSAESVKYSPVRPRAMDNSVSAPLLPSEAQLSEGSTLEGRTPGKLSSLSRISMARLATGPLMSPLSPSLSAVIAEERRRAADKTPSRRHSHISRRMSSSKRAEAAESSLGSSPSKPPEVLGPAAEDERPVNADRLQSVGGALGGLFRLKRERSKGKSDAEGLGESEG
ncbi:MAG: hypothetical protein Q9163_005536 [Psora crenata]